MLREDDWSNDFQAAERDSSRRNMGDAREEAGRGAQE
jgi:hypothetical protein